MFHLCQGVILLCKNFLNISDFIEYCECLNVIMSQLVNAKAAIKIEKELTGDIRPLERRKCFLNLKFKKKPCLMVA